MGSSARDDGARKLAHIAHTRLRLALPAPQ